MSAQRCKNVSGHRRPAVWVFYNKGVEHLWEYQDYLLAYRLRSMVGGRLRPGQQALSLSEYAGRRLERQRLAKEVFGSGDYRRQMKRVEALTDELNFGFWHNPSETSSFLALVIEEGGCIALESEAAFVEELLTSEERSSLAEREKRLVARYYLGLLRTSASFLDAVTFTRLRMELEPLRERLPIFVLPVRGGRDRRGVGSTGEGGGGDVGY
ncbi:MAG: hypothetical protein JSV66_18435 [Trueperaceae bacterium]|nr:MAG: hypothetical protein JSV66_18435 [Trueperaceae bacterium]